MYESSRDIATAVTVIIITAVVSMGSVSTVAFAVCDQGHHFTSDRPPENVLRCMMHIRILMEEDLWSFFTPTQDEESHIYPALEIPQTWIFQIARTASIKWRLLLESPLLPYQAKFDSSPPPK